MQEPEVRTGGSEKQMAACQKRGCFDILVSLNGFASDIHRLITEPVCFDCLSERPGWRIFMNPGAAER